MTRRIELYKVAAVFIFLFGLMLLFTLSPGKNPARAMALADTVHMYHADTVFLTNFDTIEIVRKQAVLREPSALVRKIPANLNRESGITPNVSCMADICPGDLETIYRFNSKNDLSRDNALRDFTVALN